MFSNVVLNVFNNPKNAGRISKPDGIADCYNFDNTAHVEFSLRIESGIIQHAQFRAQANPYIIAICSTITQMLKGKMISMVFLDPYSIKKELGDESNIDIDFCIDCVKMAIDDYKEKLAKESKNKKLTNEENLVEDNLNIQVSANIISENDDIQENTSEPEEDDDFADFFDFLDED